MARKKVVVTKEVSDGTDEPEDDPFERARQAFGDDPQGVRLEVYRYDAENLRHKYVKGFPWNRAIHNQDFIRERWGPGCYQLRFRSAEDNWTQVVDIDRDANPVVPTTAPTPSSSFGMEKLVEVLIAQNSMLLQAIVTRSGGGTDTTLIAKMMEGQQALTTSLLTSSLQKSDTTQNLLGALEKLTKFASEMQSESDGGLVGTIRGLVKDFAPVISEVIKNPPRALPPGAATVPVNGIGGSSPTGGDVSGMIDIVLRQYLPELKAAAERGEAPEELAEEILGEIPPRHYRHFDSLTLDRILSLDPHLKMHEAWIARVVECLHTRDTGEEENL